MCRSTKEIYLHYILCSRDIDSVPRRTWVPIKAHLNARARLLLTSDTTPEYLTRHFHRTREG